MNSIPWVCQGHLSPAGWWAHASLRKHWRTGKASKMPRDRQRDTQSHLAPSSTPSRRSCLLLSQLKAQPFLSLFKGGKTRRKWDALTGIRTAEDPGIVGLGRVPGMEAGMGCLCLLWMCSREDREPGTGLGTKRKKANIIPEALGRGFSAVSPWPGQPGQHHCACCRSDPQMGAT